MPDYDPPYGDEYPRPRRPRPAEPAVGLRPGVLLLLLAFAVGAGAVGAWAGGRLFNRYGQTAAPVTNPDVHPREAVANGPLDAEEVEANALYEGLKPSVVNVDTVLQSRDRYADRLLEQQTGTGSGFFWDADGRIVTNFHVVQDALRRPNMGIRVVLADRTAHPARLVGAAPDFDLAVVQIDPPDGVHPVPVATSADLKVGQKVFAIGNPFGLSLTLTAGIISNLDRAIEAPTGSAIPGAVQHTAQINPGNSGGPLLNKAGQLVGVNASISTPNGGNVGIGFAIPSDTVNRVVTEVIRTGRLVKPDLGVRLYDHKRLRRAGYEQGVMVADVVAGGPADKAKLRGVRRDPDTGRAQPGDVILSVNGEEVNSPEEFQQAVAKLKPGQEAVVRYLRNETEREAKLVAQGV
ncbi:MAG: trypsin-like peptidase domain-containing protein [Gemmataceae bacterium]|nr:trypsin-like peptidase domain-containing protein [Gemmataceae bacterium]